MFSEKDLFTRHIFRAIIAGLLMTFTAATVLNFSGAPSLATALFDGPNTIVIWTMKTASNSISAALRLWRHD